MAPTDSYNIKVLSGNVGYEWEGARNANTSTALTGASKHRLFEPIPWHCHRCRHRLCGQWLQRSLAGAIPRFQFGNAPGKNLDRPARRHRSLGTDFVATDGVNVYWAGYDPLEQKSKGKYETLVFATKTADNQLVSFGANSSPAAMEWGHTYPSVISYMQTSHQRPARSFPASPCRTQLYLFVAGTGSARIIQVLNKTSGAVAQVLTLATPATMGVDPSDQPLVEQRLDDHQVRGQRQWHADGERSGVSAVASVGAIAVSPDGNVLLATDLCSRSRPSTPAAALLWTARAVAISTMPRSPTTSSISATPTDRSAPIAYAPNGSFWVNDPGNFQVAALLGEPQPRRHDHDHT